MAILLTQRKGVNQMEIFGMSGWTLAIAAAAGCAGVYLVYRWYSHQ
jgi:hypothetical protein